jgi:hypothetical protein
VGEGGLGRTSRAGQKVATLARKERVCRFGQSRSAPGTHGASRRRGAGCLRSKQRRSEPVWSIRNAEAKGAWNLAGEGRRSPVGVRPESAMTREDGGEAQAAMQSPATPKSKAAKPTWGRCGDLPAGIGSGRVPGSRAGKHLSPSSQFHRRPELPFARFRQKDTRATIFVDIRIEV